MTSRQPYIPKQSALENKLDLLLKKINTLTTTTIQDYSIFTPPSISLRIINSSNTPNLTIIIFQKDIAVNNPSTAWRKLIFSSQVTSHTINYTYGLTITASDNNGNRTPPLNVAHGQKFRYVSLKTPPIYLGDSATGSHLEIENYTGKNNININYHKDNKILAKRIINDANSLDVSFDTLWIGSINNNDVYEGQEILDVIESSINTEISLLGIISGDIIITNSGSDLQFTLATANIDDLSIQ